MGLVLRLCAFSAKHLLQAWLLKGVAEAMPSKYEICPVRVPLHCLGLPSIAKTHQGVVGQHRPTSCESRIELLLFPDFQVLHDCRDEPRKD